MTRPAAAARDLFEALGLAANPAPGDLEIITDAIRAALSERDREWAKALRAMSEGHAVTWEEYLENLIGCDECQPLHDLLSGAARSAKERTE